MIRRISLILLLLSVSMSSFGQRFNFYKDFDKVVVETINPSSPLFFDSLYEKLVDQEKLTDEESIALLIGGTQHQGYLSNEVKLLEIEIDSLNDEGNYKRAIKVADKCLELYPLSLKAHLGIWWAYTNLEEEAKGDSSAEIARAIFNAIQSSGFGDEKEPRIGLSLHNIEEYASKHAAGAGFEFKETLEDQEGNTTVVYSTMFGVEYFVIPKNKE